MAEPEFFISQNGNVSEFWNSEDINLLNTSTTLFPLNVTVNHTRPNSAVAKFYPIIVAEMILSIICLILSIIVYSLLPEFKNVHGKNLISLSSCLLTTFTFLCLDVVLRQHISYSFCFTIGVIIHISFLATFFWTNVMAFDIWCNITSMKQTFERKRRTWKYAKYSAYAWTATVLTALPAVIFESTNFVPEEYRPMFGVKRCWLSGVTAFTYYFNLPVGVILFVNLIMFSMTVKRLWLIKKMTAILQIKQQQGRLNLYLKLFLIMGITWFTEFLPWITKKYYLYSVAGMLTALHGVFMFAIFIVKRRIFRQIKERIRGVPSSQKLSTSQPTSSTNGNQATFKKYADSKIFY